VDDAATGGGRWHGAAFPVDVCMGTRRAGARLRSGLPRDERGGCLARAMTSSVTTTHRFVVVITIAAGAVLQKSSWVPGG